MVVSSSRPKARRCLCDPLATVAELAGRTPPLPRSEINGARLGLFTERNSDGTAHLVLRGKDIHDRYGSRIQDTDIHAICRYIKHCHRRITRLDLCYNEITDTGFFVLLKKCLVKGRSSLNNLNVMNNELTDVSLERLAKYAELVRLKYLRINGNKFGNKGGEYFADFLRKNRTVECTDVGECDLTLSSVPHLLSALTNNHGTNCCLKHNETLIELHLQKNQLTSHDAECLVRGLRRNSTLLYLDLAFNRLGDAGAEWLADYLSGTPPLVLLSLAGNGVGDNGARTLSFGMPFSHVRALDLSHNRLTDEGILNLLYTIKKPRFMRFLNLWGNRIGHASCEVISRMMLSGVLFQHTTDVRVYEVDDVLYAAYYSNPADRNKHLYYCELEYGEAQDIVRIKRHHLEERASPAKVDCKHRHRLDKTDRDRF